MSGLLPRSLFGRNVLLIVGLILAGQLTTLILFRFFVQDVRLARFANVTARQIDATQTVLTTLPADRRKMFLERFTNGSQIALRQGDVAPAMAQEPDSRVVRAFVARLDEELGHRYTIVWQAEPPARLWVKLDLGDERYWIGFSADRLAADLPFAWIIVSLFSGVLALIGATIIQMRMNRPLAALVVAAERVARGQPADAPEDGPTETAAVSRSFNRMSASLAQMEADRSVMLAGVSHDLRTPLAKLRLALGILAERPAPELIAAMERHIEDVDAIIGQFLSYGRGGADETPEAIDLATLLHQMAAQYAIEHAIEYSVEAPMFDLDLAPLAPLAVRPVALRRAVTNLLENALRYGAAPRRLSLFEEGGAVCIAVQDSGAGIAVEDIERARLPFVRLGEAASQPGSGLGLAIVDRIARMHGGTLRLENLAGGFRATLSLPRVAAPTA